MAYANRLGNLEKSDFVKVRFYRNDSIGVPFFSKLQRHTIGYLLFGKIQGNGRRSGRTDQLPVVIDFGFLWSTLERDGESESFGARPYGKRNDRENYGEDCSFEILGFEHCNKCLEILPVPRRIWVWIGT